MSLLTWFGVAVQRGRLFRRDGVTQARQDLGAYKASGSLHSKTAVLAAEAVSDREPKDYQQRRLLASALKLSNMFEYFLGSCEPDGMPDVCMVSLAL